MFIVLDGIDCCGKDTQMELLSRSLEPQLVIRCPNRRTQTGVIIDSFLNRSNKIPRMAEVALFEANRWEWYDAVTVALEKNEIVLANRWFPSGMAYALASGEEYFEAVKTLVVGLPRPDLPIIIDISVDESMRRRKQRDAYEGNYDFLVKVRKSFLKLSKLYGWTIIDGEKDTSHVFRLIQDEIQRKRLT